MPFDIIKWFNFMEWAVLKEGQKIFDLAYGTLIIYGKVSNGIIYLFVYLFVCLYIYNIFSRTITNGFWTAYNIKT